MTTPRPIALVTGASSGLGKAFAEQLAAGGYDLMLLARRRDRLVALAEQLRRDSGAHSEIIEADLGDSTALDALVMRLTAAPPDLLVNNAGLGAFDTFAQAKPADLDALIDINIRAVVHLTRAALPRMIERGSGGIINIGSMLVMSGPLPPAPPPHRATYSATKAFVMLFTQGVASEVAGTGVKVMVCNPGPVRTEFFSIQGVDTSAYPAMMTADDIVTGALADFAAGQVVSVPALTEPGLLDEMFKLQLAMLGKARQNGELPARYR